MKDYTLNKKDKNGFILSYEIKGEKILIKYASGKIYETIYTKELEIDILKRMKEQVLNVDVQKFKEKVETKNYISLVIWALLILAVYLGLSISIVNFFIGSFISYECIYIIPKRFRKAKLDDMKKNKKFVENMELFQNGIKEDMGMYVNLKGKAKKTINSIIEKKELLDKYDRGEEGSILSEPTINAIDKIDPDTFDEIYELLLKNKEFSKYYDEKADTKSKTLKLNR